MCSKQEENMYYPKFSWNGVYDPDINFVLESIGANQYIGTWKDRIILYALNGYSQVSQHTYKELDKMMISFAREGILKRI